MLLIIDDPTIDPLNPSCLLHRSGNNSHSILYTLSPCVIGNGTGLQYNGKNNSLKSSLTILANSLDSNQTYQFMVRMENRQNASAQATGYLLVRTVDTQPQLIIIA